MHDCRSRWVLIVHICLVVLYATAVGCAVWRIYVRKTIRNRVGGVRVCVPPTRTIVCVNHPRILERMFEGGYMMDTDSWYPDPRIDASTLAAYAAVWVRQKRAAPRVSLDATIRTVPVDDAVTDAMRGQAFTVVISTFPHGNEWGAMTGDCVPLCRSISTAEEDRVLRVSLRSPTMPTPSWCYWCKENRCVLVADASGKVLRVLDQFRGEALYTVDAKCRYLIGHGRGHSIYVAEHWTEWLLAPTPPTHTHMCVMRRGGEVIMGGCTTAPGDRLFRIVLVVLLQR